MGMRLRNTSTSLDFGLFWYFLTPVRLTRHGLVVTHSMNGAVPSLYFVWHNGADFSRWVRFFAPPKRYSRRSVREYDRLRVFPSH